ncbi:PepSY domain-containing protein [Rummeliibacillus sp. JY-2-4R]
MTKVKHWTVLTFIVLIIIAVLILLSMWSHITNESDKSTSEVYKTIKEMYGGEITSFKNNGKEYVMELSKNGARYHVEVEAKDGKITKMERTDLVGLKHEDLISEDEVKQIIKENYEGKIVQSLLKTEQDILVYQVQIVNQTKQKKRNVLVDATTGEILAEAGEDTKTANAIVSKKKAQQIAKNRLNGTIRDTTYFETSSGGYYLVEIVSNGKVTTFQIHAVTGKIMSFTNN